MFKTLNSEVRERYVKLEIRLKQILDNLIENTNEKMITTQMSSFLKLISSSNNCIPFKFFSLFELTRIKTEDVIIGTLNNNQTAMIFCVYLIIKILVKTILVDLKFSSSIKSQNIKK